MHYDSWWLRSHFHFKFIVAVCITPEAIELPLLNHLLTLPSLLFYYSRLAHNIPHLYNWLCFADLFCILSNGFLYLALKQWSTTLTAFSLGSSILFHSLISRNQRVTPCSRNGECVKVHLNSFEASSRFYMGYILSFKETKEVFYKCTFQLGVPVS